MKILLFGLSLFFLSCSHQDPKSFKKATNCYLENKLPAFIEGCEGEMCDVIVEKYGAKVVVKLYEKPETNSKIIDKIGRCEKFKNAVQLLKIEKLNPGKVIAQGELFAEKNVKIGDVVQITHYTGEGSWAVCLGDKTYPFIYPQEKNLPANPDATFQFIEKEIHRPKEWTRVTTLRGKTGYTQKKFWIGKYDDPAKELKGCKEEPLIEKP